ncbi:E3 ubiquitin-protein ligase ATL31-like [Pyrus communis]|uniref:E3 ubiquitin-protein ligase ATL31-like n=1 Tax=Pyrus communis TaxID=23211 RepID=UPI0035BFC8FC
MPDTKTTSFNLHFLFLLTYPMPANAQSPEFQNNGYGYVNNLNSSMALISVFLVFAFFSVGFLSVYFRRCVESARMEASGTIARAAGTRAHAASLGFSRRGLDPAVIETFPILVYSAVKDLKIGKGALECAVCLSEFADFETLRLLPKCDHVFHPDCINPWLAAHATCPVCRSNLTCADSNPRATARNTDLNVEDSSSRSPIEIGVVRNDAVVLNVDENQSGDPQAVENGKPRTRSGICGKFPRSHSTGHSLIRPGLNTERYTLRLPEGVRKQLVSSGNSKLRRSTSYDVLLRRGLGSSRKGYRCGRGEGKSSVDNQIGWVDPWVMSPSFLPRGGDGNVVSGKTPLMSVKMPLDCLHVKAESSKESMSRLPV